jgi:hypothetical protein
MYKLLPLPMQEMLTGGAILQPYTLLCQCPGLTGHRKKIFDSDVVEPTDVSPLGQGFFWRALMKTGVKVLGVTGSSSLPLCQHSITIQYFQKDCNETYILVCGTAKTHWLIETTQLHRKKRCCIPVCCRVPIISIRQDGLSFEFYKRMLCCLVGDISSRYFEASQITRPKLQFLYLARKPGTVHHLCFTGIYNLYSGCFSFIFILDTTWQYLDPPVTSSLTQIEANDISRI